MLSATIIESMEPSGLLELKKKKMEPSGLHTILSFLHVQTRLDFEKLYLSSLFFFLFSFNVKLLTLSSLQIAIDPSFSLLKIKNKKRKKRKAIDHYR
jgi:hypothetical protein